MTKILGKIILYVFKFVASEIFSFSSFSPKALV